MVNPADNLRLCKSAVLPICQRFGSALNLNIHLHMLFLDGVYVASDVKAEPVFRRAPVPSTVQLQAVLERITGRIGRYLERQGLLVRDPEHDYLQLDALTEESTCMDTLRSHSITYRIAMGDGPSDSRSSGSAGTWATADAESAGGRAARNKPSPGGNRC